jgi:hypothetical protein
MNCPNSSRCGYKHIGWTTIYRGAQGPIEWTSEITMTYRGHVKNGQIALDEPARLPEGAEVNVEVLKQGNGKTKGSLGRRDLLRMPLEQRRLLLIRQSNRLTGYYESGSDRSDWQGGDIVE